MNSRIRYIKGSNKDMVGNKYYKDKDGNEYTVGYFEKGEGLVLGYVSKLGEDTSLAITATSTHKIKIAIKAKLEELGCEFEKETREKKV